MPASSSHTLVSGDEVSRKVHACGGGKFERLDTWWKENRDKNPFLFADEVDRAIDFLEIDPEGGFAIKSPVGPHFRRVPLERTRNQVYYWHEPRNDGTPSDASNFTTVRCRIRSEPSNLSQSPPQRPNLRILSQVVAAASGALEFIAGRRPASGALEFIAGRRRGVRSSRIYRRCLPQPSELSNLTPFTPRSLETFRIHRRSSPQPPELSNLSQVSCCSLSTFSNFTAVTTKASKLSNFFATSAAASRAFEFSCRSSPQAARAFEFIAGRRRSLPSSRIYRRSSPQPPELSNLSQVVAAASRALEFIACVPPDISNRIGRKSFRVPSVGAKGPT
jgi:hypothetical protein